MSEPASRDLPPALVHPVDFALACASRGARVFQLPPDGSEATFDQGDDATTDHETILARWREYPGRRVGISAEDTLIIRVTERADSKHVEQFGMWLNEHAPAPTLRTFRSDVSGKRPKIEICIFYKLPAGSQVEGRSSLFAEGIEVLESEATVVGPCPPTDNGKCEFYSPHPMAEASAWLIETCGVKLPEKENTMPNVIALKRPAAEAPGFEAVDIAERKIPVVKMPNTKKTTASTFISKKAAAQASAKQGFNVFPVWPYVHPGENATAEQLEAAAKQAKTPLIKNWQNQASQDPAQINAWWTEWPNANIGGTTETLVVVDVDPRHGGNETFATLSDLADFPATAVHNTQGGGQHHIYAAPDRRPVKGGTNKLGAGVDIKARGGYILLPGSTIEGRAYTRTDDRPISLAPQWIVDQCNAARAKTDNAGKRLLEEDDTAVDLATQWILNHAPSADYGAIDDTTYKVAARLYDFGVTYETALDLMLEWNELKCNPPGDTDRLEVVTESAGRNRENAIGSKHRDAPGFEAVEIVERPATLPGETRQSASPETKTRGPPIKAVPLAPFVASEIPHRRWVISDYACRGVVTTLVGPGGMSKSTLLLQKALALATGRGEICGFHIPKAVKAWVWNQEDDMQEMQRRIAAIMQAFGVSWDDLKDEHGEPRLFISSGVERPLTLAVRKDHGAVVGTPQVDEIISEIKANSIGAFFADPLVEFHEADENSNIQMRAVLGQVRRIAVEGDCAALLSAHTRKPPQASSDGFAGDMDSMRGGGSQVGVVRVGATLFSMSEKDAKAHVIPASKARHDYVRLDIGKNNLAPKPQEPMWFLREGAMIGARFEHKGESVGYLRPVKLDRTKGGAKKISTQSLPTVLAEIMATAGMFERYVKISEVVATGTPEQAAIFGDKKNRSAIVKAGFDGRTESLEDAGRVSFRADQGREMTVYLMRREQLPKVENSAGSKLGNEEKSEA